MPHDKPSGPRPDEQPKEADTAPPAAPADPVESSFTFNYDPQAYGLLLGLLDWNNPKNWYFGEPAK